MFNNFFAKIAQFMIQCGEMRESQTGHRWQNAICMQKSKV
jgi:hypothetical protein